MSLFIELQLRGHAINLLGNKFETRMLTDTINSVARENGIWGTIKRVKFQRLYIALSLQNGIKLYILIS